MISQFDWTNYFYNSMVIYYNIIYIKCSQTMSYDYNLHYVDILITFIIYYMYVICNDAITIYINYITYIYII